MLRPIAPGLLAILLLSPAAARAQIGGGGDGDEDSDGLIVEITNIDGRSQERFRSLEGARSAINRRECAEDVEITLWVQNFPVDENGANVLDIWRGTSANCADPAVRTDTTIDDCERLTIEEDQEFNVRDRRGFTVRASELVDCEEEEVSEYEIWFLATAGGENADAVSYHKKRVTVRTRLPRTPENTRALDGQNSSTVRWDTREGTEQSLRFYQVFTDWSGCGAIDDEPPPVDAGGPTDAGVDAGTDAGVDAGTDAGTNDEDPTETGEEIDEFVPPGYHEVICSGDQPDVPVPVPEGMTCEMNRVDIGASSVQLTFPEGFEIGDQAGVALVAIDRALNPSEPALVCIERIETVGLCEAVDGCPDTGCAVKAPGAKVPTAALLLGLAAIGLLYFRRRRR